MKNVTIKEVAARAGLSITTVSRALNNNYPVSAEARIKIERAVKELGYRPNMVARSLKNNNTKIIGLVVADISNRYFMKIAKKLEDSVSAQGYQIIYASSDGNIQKEHQIISMFEERCVDALVIASSDNKPDRLNELSDKGVPIIAIDRRIPGLRADLVMEDNFHVSRQLAVELIQAGHSRIAFNNVLMSTSSGKERLEGAMKAMKDYGIPVRADWVSRGGFSSEDSRRWIKDIFSSEGDVPTAVFCANNVMAEGTLLALKEAGTDIPGQVSVVSFGQLPMQQLIEPRIKSVVQEPERVGEIAGGLVMMRLQGNNSSFFQYEIPLKIEKGDSVEVIG